LVRPKKLSKFLLHHSTNYLYLDTGWRTTKRNSTPSPWWATYTKR